MMTISKQADRSEKPFRRTCDPSVHGNALAKLANGITDTPALMAAKSPFTQQQTASFIFIDKRRPRYEYEKYRTSFKYENICFVPFGQDDPEKAEFNDCPYRSAYPGFWKPLLRTGSFSLSYAILSKIEGRIFYVESPCWWIFNLRIIQRKELQKPHFRNDESAKKHRGPDDEGTFLSLNAGLPMFV